MENNDLGRFLGDVMRAMEEFVSDHPVLMTAIRWVNAGIIGLVAFFGLYID